jgi:large subunit ribosomal protein L1
MAKRGKKYEDAKQLVDSHRDYTIAEACDLVKRTAIANFDESVDLDLRLGVDPRHADQMVRGTVTLPHGTGQEVSVLAMVSESYQEEAVEAGADHVGLDDYIEKIEEENWTDVDVIIATPDVMGKIGKLGRILGPRGLMPNPKSGTVTTDVAQAVEEAKAGKIEFRVDRYGQLHTTVSMPVNCERMSLHL